MPTNIQKQYKPKYRKLKIQAVRKVELQFDKFDMSYIDENIYIKENRLVDAYFNEIEYNKVYFSKNPNSLGAEFIVINRFGMKGKKLSKDTLLLNIQVIRSRMCYTINYYRFLNRDIYDPYYPTLFDRCCIGNILLDSEWIMYVFNAWREIIGRCFDRTHKLFPYYGRNCTMPLHPSWLCFEEFFKFIDRYYHERELDLAIDPNDFQYYYFLFNPTINDAYQFRKYSNGQYAYTMEDGRVLKPLSAYHYFIPLSIRRKDMRATDVTEVKTPLYRLIDKKNIF